MATLNIENGDSNAIRYNVVRNAILEKNTGERSYCARVYTKTKSLREVAETMVREGSKYSAYEVYTILEAFATVVTRLLQEGNAVNVGSLVRFRPSIIGKFKEETESFTRGTHQIKIRASIGASLRNVAASAAVARVTAAIALPELLEVCNGATGNPNTVSNGATFIVKGTSLDYNAESTDEGFFVNLDGQELRCTVVMVNTDDIILLMPHTLSEGNEVELIFRTRHTTNGNLITVTYGEMLTYEATPAE